MKANNLYLVLIVLVLASSFQVIAQDEIIVTDNAEALSAEAQNALLATRVKSPISGNFGSVGSFLYAIHDLAIHTDHKEVSNTKLDSPFMSDYEPTWREVFDTVATQTQTNWAYDAKRNYWLFTPTTFTTPYELTLAKDWISKNRGIYVGYKPPTFPVGMDIYQLGTYSADNPKDEAKLFKSVQEYMALRFAIGFNKNIKAKDMKSVKVDGVDALYFEAQSPQREEITWRQWAFVKNGKAFIIVSSLRKQDKNLVEDVQAMVKSFKVK